MAGLRLGGLASGMDTETIITQLMAIEAAPKTRMLTQQKLFEGRKTAIEDVARQLRALSTAIADLRSTTTWGDVQAVTTSDATKVAARTVGSAPAGNVTVEVSQLARSEQRVFTWGAPDASFAIDGVAVDLSAATNATEAAAKINATSGVKVYAGVVNNQLVLTGKQLGQPIAVTGEGALVQTNLVAAQMTRYTINGIPQDDTIASVVQPGGLPGVELTLKAETSGPVTIGIGAPGPDAEKVKAKVKSFVDAYNATVDLVRGKLSEKKVASPTVSTDFPKGALRNDVTLNKLLTDLRQTLGAVADATPGTIDTLAEIGIAIPKTSGATKSSPEALAGKLELDADKLTSALTSDPGAIETLLGGGGATGIAQTLEGFLDPVTKAVTGYLAQATTTADRQAAEMRNKQTDFDKRLTLREDRLRAMFTAMETALNSSQSQSSWLEGQLGSLPSWS